MKLVTTAAWTGAIAAVAGLIVECVNLRFFPALRPARGRDRSIVACLAVRDEARTVQKCIDGLLAQPEIEAVAVCDDRSRDATQIVLERLANANPRVWLARLPRGARGSKSAALAAAAQRAIGCDVPFLLFTDADVTFEFGAAGALLQRARECAAHAVSAWPRVRTRTVADTLLAPLVPELLLQVLPMWRSRDPRCTAATGQALLVDRLAYVESGGHAQIESIVEDVALARRLRTHGYRVALASGARVLAVDGYGSMRAGWDGLGRSLFGTGAGACAAYALWHALLAIAPALVRRDRLPAAVAFTAVIAARALQAERMSESPLTVGLAPASHAVAAIGAVRALVLGRRGVLRWRGRPVA
jgi:Glycosyltransferase like family 2